MIIKQLAEEGLITPPPFVREGTVYAVYTGSAAYGVTSDISDLDVYGNRYHVAKRVTCGAREAQRTELSNQLKRVSFARRLGSIGPAWLDACKSVPPVLNIPDVTLRDYDDRPLACYENTNPLAVWRLYATGEGRTLWCWLPTTGSSYAWSLKGV